MTEVGKGDNHRSGLNSKTSSPQISLFKFDARMAMTTVVPAGTGISFMMVPSVAWRGSERGIMISFCALFGRMDVSTEGGRYFSVRAYSLNVRLTGGYLREVL